MRRALKLVSQGLVTTEKYIHCVTKK